MDPASMQAMLIETLQQASNQNVCILKQAEIKLSEWETQPGFYIMIYNIAANHSIDSSVRFMALTYIKIGVDKYWRKNAPNAISEEEKKAMRAAFLTNFNEPIIQLASQLAAVISKVARMDAPQDWPELFPTLIQAVENNDVLIQHRAILTMHQVIKAMSTKRLTGYRRIFQEFSKNIFPFTLNLWNKFMDTLSDHLRQNSNTMIIKENIEKSLLLIKILRKLTLFGFYKPAVNENFANFMHNIFERLRDLMEYQKTLNDLISFKNEYEKLITNLMKSLIGVLDMHPLSFVEYIKPTLEFTIYYNFSTAGDGILFERFIIQSFELIKEIVMCAEFKPAKLKGATKDVATLVAHQAKVDFFQPNVVTEVCNKLVSYYFILKQEDLEKWDLDPETFMLDEAGGESWKYNLKPAMECLFVALFRENRAVCSPVLLQMVHEASGLVSPDDVQGILRKDAVYNAAGLVAFDMFDELDFNQWFATSLLDELNIKHNNYRIIRRRVILLISSWIGVQLEARLRPMLYAAINGLLVEQEDMAVKLAAAVALRSAIDDYLYNAEQFRPYINTTFGLLFNLLQKAKECDTKMQVLNTLTVMIERAGETFVMHHEILFSFLPLLWAESEDHNMLRCAIVSALVQLVSSYGSIRNEVYQFLLPVIHLGTDTQQNAIIYLLEDCLELWQVVLEHSSEITNEILLLFNNLPPLFEYSTEYLRMLLQIVDAYLLLAPDLIIETQIHQIVKVYDAIIGDLKFEGTVALQQLILNIVTVSPQLGTQAIKPILPRVLKNIISHDDYSSAIKMSLNLCILARVLLSSFNTFTETIRELGQMENKTEIEVLTEYLDVWLNKMQHYSRIEHRKILAIALASLLTSQSSVVLERFSEIMVNITEVLNDLIEDDGSDGLIITEEGGTVIHITECFGPSEHGQRRKKLLAIDPTFTIVLKDHLQSQITTLKNQVGEGNYLLLMQKLRESTVSTLREYNLIL